MKRIRNILAVAVALSACAGPRAGGQVGPSPGEQTLRPNIYEIAPEQVAQNQDSGFIEVNGTAMVSVTPDRASVAFAVETRAQAASQAASQNADVMDAVLRAIRGGSFPDLDLETFGYAVRPEYAQDTQRTREIVAYIALNNVRATTSDVEAVGRLIDVSIAAGANRIAGVSFSAANTDEAASRALGLAVENARAQAEVIATSLGYELGAPLEVRGGSQHPGPVPMDMMRAGESFRAAPTPIEGGDQTVTASVTVRFALGRESGG
jgi:hypothetical protein